MDYAQRYYPEMKFGGFSRVDGTIAFYSRVQALTGDDATVIDVGCGRGAAAEDSIPWRRAISTLRGHRRHVIGIDVDPVGATNPLLDEFRKIDDTTRWPIDDAVADVCVADYVLEHVTDPRAFFSECRRVLKPGGYLCVRTPNRLGYVTIISSLIPNRLHSRAVQIGQATRKAEDVFPTVYRSNTRWRLRRDLQRNGFDPCIYGHEPEPGYLGFSRIAFTLGVLHQRWAPEWMKLVLLAFARRVD
jgi:SAM-dependent methyltransferase